jgi:NitT/TauT family transport system permease protein
MEADVIVPRRMTAGRPAAWLQPVWATLLAFVVAAAGATAPYLRAGGESALAVVHPLAFAALALGALAALAGRGLWPALAIPAGFAAAFAGTLELPGTAAAGLGFWSLFWGSALGALAAVGRISLVTPPAAEHPLRALVRRALPPLSVPIALVLVWQALVVGNAVPKGIFPSVGHVVTALRATAPVLLADAYVTFVKEVAFGLSLGVAAGLVAGVLIAHSSFLRRGVLPLAAGFGAVPIVGLAPVLGRAFGVDWESKAAVVVIVTFFPVVLNTVQGLTSIDPARLELLHAYAARPWQIFTRLRVPNALPYVFNALKLASVLAIISVIVAEFLIPGPPEGLGQRISLSARRGAFDVVFAAIFVSSTVSILIYGALTALERRVTHWHASFRDRGA